MLLASPRDNRPRRPDYRWVRVCVRVQMLSCMATAETCPRVENVGRRDDDAQRRLTRVARHDRDIAIYSSYLRA
jgi:hypothetical protein